MAWASQPKQATLIPSTKKKKVTILILSVRPLRSCVRGRRLGARRVDEEAGADPPPPTGTGRTRPRRGVNGSGRAGTLNPVPWPPRPILRGLAPKPTDRRPGPEESVAGLQPSKIRLGIIPRPRVWDGPLGPKELQSHGIENAPNHFPPGSGCPTLPPAAAQSPKVGRHRRGRRRMERE